MSSSNRTSPQARDKDKGNAFSVLMSNKKRKSVSYSGGAMLVNCPVCSKTMPNIRLNAHLDVCIQAGNMEGNVVVASPVPVGLEKRFDENEDKDKANEYHTQSAQVSQTQSAEKNINCIKIDMDENDVNQCHLIENQNAFLDEVICDEGDDANKVLVSSSSNQNQGGSLTVKKQKKNIENDAFSRMMKQSVAVFSTPSLPRKQNFHLHSNFTVSWEEYDGPGTFASLNLNKWSSSIMIKKEPIETDSAEAYNDSKAFNVGPSKCQYQDLELYVTSSVASASGMPRLVCRQSRLSVPTLKSILQKAIRRKLPLAAVRVALELATKSWGDLVRRLPIIILEDSTLHYDFPFTVWAMVAEAKSFVPPMTFIAKIMRIIFEIASCPLQDNLPRGQKYNRVCSLRTKVIEKENFDRPEYALIIRSILLRASFGGMACDVSMLMDYADTWRTRFHDVFISKDISNRIRARLVDSNLKDMSCGDQVQLRWDDVPRLFHSKASLLSVNNVNPLVMNGIESLALRDICLAGIDFHCSAILEDVVVADKEVYEKTLAIVSKYKTSEEREVPQWIHVLGVGRDCMWQFSSGVNRRMKLVGSGSLQSASFLDPEDSKTKLYKETWDCISSGIESYARKYVETRLVR